MLAVAFCCIPKKFNVHLVENRPCQVATSLKKYFIRKLRDSLYYPSNSVSSAQFPLSKKKENRLSRATQQRRFTFFLMLGLHLNLSQSSVFIYPHKMFVQLALMVYRLLNYIIHAKDGNQNSFLKNSNYFSKAICIKPGEYKSRRFIVSIKWKCLYCRIY